MKLSIGIPVYNGSEIIKILIENSSFYLNKKITYKIKNKTF